MKKNALSNSEALRARAEEKMKSKASSSGADLTVSGREKLLHELEVHQIELEMQNEELMAARQAARLALEHYEDLYDFAPLGYFSLSEAGDILEANLAGSQILGPDRLHLINHSFVSFLDSGYRANFQQFLDDVFTSRVKLNFEATLTHGNMEKVTVALSGVATETGRNCLLTLVDITGNKKLEIELNSAADKLQEMNGKLARSQHIAHFGSWESYIPTGEFTWSDEMYRIMGFTLGTPVSQAEATSVFTPEEMERMKVAVRLAISDGTPYSIDYRIIRNDGSECYIHDEGEVIRDEHGQPLWMFGTTQDITGRKLAEISLIRKIEELKRFHRLTVGREMAMIGLKKEVNELLQNAGREPKYRIVG